MPNIGAGFHFLITNKVSSFLVLFQKFGRYLIPQTKYSLVKKLKACSLLILKKDSIVK